MGSIKTEVIKLVNVLPDDCTLEDIQCRLRDLQASLLMQERTFTVNRTKTGRLEQISLCHLLLLILVKNGSNLPMWHAINTVHGYLSATGQIHDVDMEYNNKNDWENWECDLRHARQKGVEEGWLEANARNQPWRLT